MQYKHLLCTALLVIPLVLAGGSAMAGAYEDGVAAYKAADYATAAARWRPLADAGDPRAENNIGVLYEKGWGVDIDYNAAADWYRKAARLGHPGARKNLADLHARGLIGDDASDDLLSEQSSPAAAPIRSPSVALPAPAPKKENCFWKGGADRAACDCRNTGYVQGTPGFDQCFALLIQKQADDNARAQQGVANALRIYQMMQPPPPARLQTQCTTMRLGTSLQTNCW